MLTELRSLPVSIHTKLFGALLLNPFSLTEHLLDIFLSATQWKEISGFSLRRYLFNILNHGLHLNEFIFIQIGHNICFKKQSRRAFDCVANLDFHRQTSPRCVKLIYLWMKWREAVGTQFLEQRTRVFQAAINAKHPRFENSLKIQQWW